MTSDGKPLQLSLDASSVPTHPTGAGRYVLELVRALARRSDVGLHVVCRDDDTGRWQAAGAATTAGEAPGPRPLRLAWEQVGLPRLLARMPVDVHHSPHYTMPERARLPRVVTVHDVSFLEHPEWHERVKTPFFRRAIRVASARADAVVAVSAITAERLRTLVAPRAPVHVVAHGVDHARYRPVAPGVGDGLAADEAARRRIGARAPYLAFVGTLEPRKDVATLVRAFDRLAGSRPDLTLVVAGAAGWGARAVDDAVQTAAHGDRVRRPGYVSEDEKIALLRGAAVVAYASLDEGFGLPALEAMACGTPLVTTAGTAMAEVTGDAALLVAPGDAGELALALEACLEGGPGVERRVARGIERAAGYTWDASAEAHVAVYRAVL